MPTLKEQIDALKNTPRPSGHGTTDPVTGAPTAARSKVLPDLLNRIMTNSALKANGMGAGGTGDVQTGADGKPVDPYALPGAPGGTNQKVYGATINQALQPDPSVVAARVYEANRAAEEKRRPRGQGANIVGGASGGLLGTPNLKRRTLLGT